MEEEETDIFKYEDVLPLQLMYEEIKRNFLLLQEQNKKLKEDKGRLKDVVEMYKNRESNIEVSLRHALGKAKKSSMIVNNSSVFTVN